MRRKDLMIGQSLDRYLLESQLGEGGMGVVYKARDIQLQRTVAIKILPPDKVADPERKRRFVQEARAASALNHPNIVTIFDIRADGDTDFIVMEYVAGQTLDRALQSAALPMRQALKCAVQIADALARAHDAGIIHRDLKPSNVMVTASGSVKVLDFGVAKLLEADEPSAPTKSVVMTDEGTAVGTPAYMSPEQAEGRPLDGRSDIFSLGSVLYEMVTGRRAFSGESRLSVLAKVLSEDPPPPSRLSAGVPADLEKVILRCLRKDASRRFQTMADLRVALEDLVVESGGTAPSQVTAPPSAFPWRPVLMAIGVVAAVAGGAYFATQLRRAPMSGEALSAVPLTSLPGVVRYPTLSPDGNHVAFTWTGPKQDNPDIYVQQIGVGTQIRVTTNLANDHSPSWSPDGRAIAFLRRGTSGTTTEAWLVPPLGGSERKLADLDFGLGNYRALSVGWCPDSSCVLVTHSVDDTPGAVFVISIATLEKRQLTFPRGRGIDVDPAISPDGRWLVFRRDTTPFSGAFHRLALKAGVVPDGEPVTLTSTLNSSKPVWMPDSREVLFSARGGLWRLDAVNGGSPERLPFVGQDGLAPVVARMPDGRQRLVYVRSFSDGNIWRVDTAREGAPASASPVAVITTTRGDYIPNVSPVDNRVAFLSNRLGEQEIWVADADGGNAVQVSTLGISPGFPRWSPDGKLITFHGDPRGRPDVMVVAASGGQPTIVTEHVRNGGFPSFSRDGRWIYFCVVDDKRDGRIWKIPASGGKADRVTPNAGALAIESVDGRDLYYVEAGDRPSPIWRMPVGGGTPVKVVDGVLFTSFDVLEHGLYYLDRASGETGAFYTERPGGETRLQYLDFGTGRSITIASNLGTVGPGVSATRDGRMIFFTRVDSAVDELMLVENFR